MHTRPCLGLSKDTQEHELKHPNSMDLITTKQKQKQTKLPSFIR
jgi:hypothetical protein